MAFLDDIKKFLGPQNNAETLRPFIEQARKKHTQFGPPPGTEAQPVQQPLQQPIQPVQPPAQPPIQQPTQQPIQAPAQPAQQDPVIDAINRYFPEDSAKARAIFTHESQLGKFFQNLQGAPAYGVAQIYLPVWGNKIPGNTDEEKIEWLRDPDNNLKFARMIYDDSLERHGDGWLPWESYTTGKYEEFLQ